jgi:glutamate-1-semialdehyde 2,1-aminomutase
MFQKSISYHHAAGAVIAGAVNSNVRLGSFRLCFSSASGSKLIDVDGNEYIDYALGMGPTILGHAPEFLIAAVAKTLQTGQLFAGQHQSELVLAELLRHHIPSAELVRIGMTGSEMVQAALRVARAYTNRTGFIKFEGQYHGWFDNVLVNQSGPAGNRSGSLPFRTHLQTKGQAVNSTVDTHVLPWNDADAVSRYLVEHGSKIAAIITEPVMCNTGVIPPRPGYLEELRRLCNQHGVVLIFDEVITGFRLGLSGAQGKFGVCPDLSIFAKAFGGGFPIAALAGRREIMSLFATADVNHSGTYNANLISIAAGIATINQLAADHGAAYSRIETTGQKLITGMREIAARRSTNLKITGFGSIFHTLFSDEPEIVDYASYKGADAVHQKAFIEALLPLGVRPTSRGTWFVSAAHSDEDVSRTLAAVDTTLTTEFQGVEK